MRWKPSKAQLNLIVDCSTARVSIGSTAALLGVSPRTLRTFSKRIEKARAEAEASGKDMAINSPEAAENSPRGELSAKIEKAAGGDQTPRHTDFDPAVYGEFAKPHWRDLLAEVRGVLSAGWRKPRIEELSLSREEMDRIFAA